MLPAAEAGSNASSGRRTITIRPHPRKGGEGSTMEAQGNEVATTADDED